MSEQTALRRRNIVSSSGDGDESSKNRHRFVQDPNEISRSHGLMIFIPIVVLYVAVSLFVLYFSGILGSASYDDHPTIVTLDLSKENGKIWTDFTAALGVVKAGKNNDGHVSSPTERLNAENDKQKKRAALVAFYKNDSNECAVFKRQFDKIAKSEEFANFAFAAADLSVPQNKQLARIFSVDLVPSLVLVYRHTVGALAHVRVPKHKNKYRKDKIVEFVLNHLTSLDG